MSIKTTQKMMTTNFWNDNLIKNDFSCYSIKMIVTTRQRSCGKIMFSVESVRLYPRGT